MYINIGEKLFWQFWAPPSCITFTITPTTGYYSTVVSVLPSESYSNHYFQVHDGPNCLHDLRCT